MARYTVSRSRTDDCVKLMPAMRLSEYRGKFMHLPWLPSFGPFENWNSANPTKSLAWYNDYNAVKHDREANFNRATLHTALEAVAAVWIMVADQFGFPGIRTFIDLKG